MQACALLLLAADPFYDAFLSWGVGYAEAFRPWTIDTLNDEISARTDYSHATRINDRMIPCPSLSVLLLRPAQRNVFPKYGRAVSTDSKIKKAQ